MFEKSLCLSGTMQESKQYYSEKHQLYGTKTGISALLSGEAIGFSSTHPRSVTDIKIFRQNMEWYTDASRKKDRTEVLLDNDGELREPRGTNGLFYVIRRTSNFRIFFAELVQRKSRSIVW